MEVGLYLEPSLHRRFSSGGHNFLTLLAEVLGDAGMQVSSHDDRPLDQIHSHQDDYSLIYMKPPTHERCLVFRRSYFYPFWQIETTDKRWNWRIAKAEFDSASIGADQANQFVAVHKSRLFTTHNATSQDQIFIPLQGMLLEHRSFQSCSPIEMITAVAKARTTTAIAIGLHPKEKYSVAEKQALDALLMEY